MFHYCHIAILAFTVYSLLLFSLSLYDTTAIVTVYPIAPEKVALLRGCIISS